MICAACGLLLGDPWDQCNATPDVSYHRDCCPGCALDAQEPKQVEFEHGTCSNARDYDGPLYVLTRLGRPGMKLMPDLAETLPARLRSAAEPRECVQFRHKVLGVWVNVRRMKLTSDAALVLADTLDQATA